MCPYGPDPWLPVGFCPCNMCICVWVVHKAGDGSAVMGHHHEAVLNQRAQSQPRTTQLQDSAHASTHTHTYTNARARARTPPAPPARRCPGPPQSNPHSHCLIALAPCTPPTLPHKCSRLGPTLLALVAPPYVLAFWRTRLLAHRDRDMAVVARPLEISIAYADGKVQTATPRQYEYGHSGRSGHVQGGGGRRGGGCHGDHAHQAACQVAPGHV